MDILDEECVIEGAVTVDGKFGYRIRNRHTNELGFIEAETLNDYLSQ